MKVLLVALNVLCVTALMSVLFDLMESRADLVFILVTGFAGLTAFIGSLLYSKFDKTNGNGSGLISAHLVLCVDVVVAVAAPVIVLCGVPYVPVTVVSLVIILVWTGYNTYSLIL